MFRFKLMPFDVDLNYVNNEYLVELLHIEIQLGSVCFSGSLLYLHFFPTLFAVTEEEELVETFCFAYDVLFLVHPVNLVLQMIKGKKNDT